MGWFMPHMYGSGMIFMGLGSLIFLGLIAAAVVVVIGAGGVRPTRPAAASTAQTLLAERYARGEIDDEEYQRVLRALRQ